MERERMIIDCIENDLRMQREADNLGMEDLGNEWTGKMDNEPGRFLADEIKVKVQELRDFRKKQIFIPDTPVSRQTVFNLRNLIDGSRRGHVKILKSLLSVIEKENFCELLTKYPCSTVGNPNIFFYKGFSYTFRWIRHIYLLGVFKRLIEPEIGKKFVSLDLGCSYGILSSLLHREYPQGSFILVDLPQQLALANYYLGMEFPQAKIATYKDIAKWDKIDRAQIEKFDFVLMPWYLYNKIQKGSVDVFSNFMSLGEMGRKYFDYYLKQEPFLSAKIFFTINRYQSAPTYDNGLTILDYPLSDFRRIRFLTSPSVVERYQRLMLIFYTSYPYPSQHFEFIGKR